MRKKINKTPLFFILLIILSAVVLFLFTLNLRDRKLDEYSRRISDLKELVTVRHTYRNVIYTETRENFIVDKRSLFAINYVVTAGVDLSAGVKIKADLNSIIVSYPYPVILSIDADESSIDQYYALERFGKLKQSDYLNVLYDEKVRIEEEALKSGILEQADNNLQRLISGILKEGGIKDVIFENN